MTRRWLVCLAGGLVVCVRICRLSRGWRGAAANHRFVAAVCLAAAGRPRSVLRRLPQQPRQDRWTRARCDRSAARGRARGDIGKGRAEAAWPHDAPCRAPAARRRRPTTPSCRSWRRRSTGRPRAMPNPGRTDTFRRLNRTEYQNAIRDLLALDVDVSALLPKDDVSHGFDNVGVGEFSPTLLERYLAAAQKVSRLAVGSPLPSPASHIVVLPADLTQEDHFDGLPFGTRGGTVVRHTFPLDGTYEIQVRLSRDRNENVEGLTEPHQLEVTLDGDARPALRCQPNRNVVGAYYADEAVDKNLNVRVPVQAGPHEIGVTFPRKTFALPETERQPYKAHFNMDRHPRIQPAVYSVSRHRAVRRRPGGRHAEPGPYLRVLPREGCGGSRLRQDDSLDAGAPRLSTAGHRCGPPGAARVLPGRTSRGRVRRRHRNGASGHSRQHGVPVPRRTRSARRGAEHGLSRQRSGAGLSLVVLPVEQHPRRRAARRWPSTAR